MDSEEGGSKVEVPVPSTPQGQMVEAPGTPPVQMAPVVSTPQGQMVEAPGTPPVQMAPVVSTPQGQMVEAPSTPPGQMAPAVSTPRGQMVEAPSTPPGQMAPAVSTPRGQMVEAPGTPPGQMAPVVSTPRGQMVEAPSTPPGQMAPAVSTPRGQMVEAPGTPPVQMAPVVSTPRGQMVEVPSTPPVQMAPVVSTPRGQMVEAPGTPPVQMDPAVSTPQGQMVEVPGTPPAQMAPAVSTPRGQMVEVPSTPTPPKMMIPHLECTPPRGQMVEVPSTPPMMMIPHLEFIPPRGQMAAAKSTSSPVQMAPALTLFPRGPMATAISNSSLVQMAREIHMANAMVPVPGTSSPVQMVPFASSLPLVVSPSPVGMARVESTPSPVGRIQMVQAPMAPVASAPQAPQMLISSSRHNTPQIIMMTSAPQYVSPAHAILAADPDQNIVTHIRSTRPHILVDQTEFFKKFSNIVNNLGFETENQFTFGGPNRLILSLLSDTMKFLNYLPGNHGKSLEWCTQLDDLVQILKKCLMIKHNPHRRRHPPPGYDLVEESKAPIGEFALDILHHIYKSLTSKESFHYFVGLMKRSNAGPGFLDAIEAEYNGSVTYPHLLCAELELVQSILLKSKLTLKLGEGKAVAHRHVPFTSFGAKVATSLENLAQFLINSLQYPKRKYEHDFMYDLIVTLSQVTPFHRLDSKLFELILNFALERIQQKPACYPRSPVLRIFRTILSTDLNGYGLSFDPIYALPKDNHFGINRLVGLSALNLRKWLLYVTGGNGPAEKYYLDRASEAALDVALISSFARYHFPEFLHCIRPCIRIINELLYLIVPMEGKVFNFLARENPNITIGNPAYYDDKLSSHMAPFLETIGFFQTLFHGLNKLFKDEYGNSEDVEVVEDEMEEGEILEAPAPALLPDQTEMLGHVKSYLLRAPELANTQCNSLAILIVDSFACIGESLFNQLDDVTQRHIIVSSLGFSADTRNEVRAKAGRVIAHLLEFDELVKSRDQFLSDALNRISLNYTKGDLGVRTPYAWALGNLAHSLGKFYKESIPCGRGIEFINTLHFLAIRMSVDHPKIRYNGNRALGCLLKWLPESFMSDEKIEEFVKAAVDLLGEQVASGNEFKARWNACYALGNTLQNEGLVKRLGQLLIKPALTSFIKGLTKSENYKERINCIKGIMKIPNRESFGTDYDGFWISWDALFRSYHREVPGHVKGERLITPRAGNCTLNETFIAVIASGLMYLTSLIVPTDLNLLEELFFENSETFKGIIDLGGPESTPEKTEHLAFAKSQVESLLANGHGDHAALKLLRYIYLDDQEVMTLQRPGVPRLKPVQDIFRDGIPLYSHPKFDAVPEFEEPAPEVPTYEEATKKDNEGKEAKNGDKVEQLGTKMAGVSLQ